MSFKVRLIVGFVFLLTQSAFAAVICTDKSPRIAQQGDKYWDIQPTGTIDPASKSQFQQRFSQFVGRIEGSLQHEECTGNKDKIEIKSSRASVKGTLEQSDGGVKLILEITDLKDKSVKNERIELLGRASTVDFSASPGGGFQTLQKIRANASNADKISLLRESEYAVSFSKKTLIIHSKHYANGYFYAEDNWVITGR